MDLKRSSYHFHAQLESPSAFIGRNWKLIATCTGLFCLVMTAAVLLIDPAFFYPRLQTDPLNYYLKAQAFIETGSTVARWTVNAQPFQYVSMPGILRAPIIAAFSDFDDQLRGIQLSSIPLVAFVTLSSAYIFSWVLPRSRHWWAIVFAFAFTLLSPIWIANIFLPLADAPYAAFTFAALFVAIEILCSDRRATARPLLVLFFLILFVICFLLRFTAPVVILFAAVLALARWDEHQLSRRVKLGAILATAVVLAPLVAFNSEAIFKRYFNEPLYYLERSEATGVVANLIASALPSQVIPSFQLGFLHPPIQGLYGTAFATTIPDLAWAAFGVLISMVIVAGMWQSRSKLLPELVYIGAPLPVMALMIPSTSRYLMSYQPFFWIFFYVGFAWAVNRYVPGVKRVFRSRVAIASVAVALVALVGGLRWWKTAGSASERYFAVTATRIPDYVSDVSTTFRSLRNFIETLPPERTLLIGIRGTMGRWKAISGRDYYYPDSTLTGVAKEKDVYLLIECGTMEACQAWDVWKDRNENRVQRVGDFVLDSVFAVSSRQARAEVLRVRPLH